MKITNLLGKTIKWKIGGYVAGDGHRNTSQLHKDCRVCIRSIFKLVQFKEEVPIPTGKTTLFLDFYIPVHKMAIEVHGEQHYKYIQHFHQTAANFMSHKQRDKDKATWCEINGITLITLPYNESQDEWRERIHRARHGKDEEGDRAS